MQSVIRRGAETKQRWSWVQGERTGSIFGLLGRVMGCYIKAVREEIPHFPIVFLSLLFLTNKSSLLSLVSFFFCDGREWWFRPRFGAAVRRPAVVGGGAAAVNTLSYFFFLLFRPLFSPLTHISTHNSQIKVKTP